MKPVFLESHNLLQHSISYFESQKYITIVEKSKNSYYLMYCDESGNIKDIYAVIAKRFKSPKKAEEYFNKYFKNVTLIYDNNK